MFTLGQETYQHELQECNMHTRVIGVLLVLVGLLLLTNKDLAISVSPILIIGGIVLSFKKT